jgi:hypothetical protein
MHVGKGWDNRGEVDDHPTQVGERPQAPRAWRSIFSTPTVLNHKLIIFTHLAIGYV